MSRKLNTWSLYQNTKDFPGLYVARRFELAKPTPDHFADADVNQVRNWIKLQAESANQGAPYCIPRQKDDDPVIVETWV